MTLRFNQVVSAVCSCAHEVNDEMQETPSMNAIESLCLAQLLQRDHNVNLLTASTETRDQR